MKLKTYLAATLLCAGANLLQAQQADFDWQSVLKTTSSSGWMEAKAMCKGSAANFIYVAGDFRGTVQFPTTPTVTTITSGVNTDIFIARYSNAGVLQNVVTFDMGGDEHIEGATLFGTDVYVVANDIINGYGYVAKANSTLDVASKLSHNAGFVQFTDITTVGANVDLVLSGYYQNGYEELVSANPASFPNIVFTASHSGIQCFVARMNSGMNFTTGIDPGTASDFNIINSIFWRAGLLYVAGSFSGTFQPNSTSATASGAHDAWVCSMSAPVTPTTSLGWNNDLITGGGSVATTSPPSYFNTLLWHDAAYDVIGTTTGVYVTGHLEGNGTFGTQSYTGDGVFVARFATLGGLLVTTGTYPQYLTVGTGCSGSTESAGYALGVNGTSGNVFVTGYADHNTKFGTFCIGGTEAPAFFAQLDASGTVIRCEVLNRSQTAFSSDYTKPYDMLVFNCDLYICGSLPYGQFSAGKLAASPSFPATHMFLAKATKDFYISPNVTSCGTLPLTIPLQVLSSGASSYSWSPGTNLSATNVSNPTFTLSSGSISITYTATTTGTCPGSATVSVTAGPYVIANAGADHQVCPGNVIVLGGAAAVAGVSYSWSPTSNLSNPSIAQPTLTVPAGGLGGTVTYTLTVTSACGQNTSDAAVMSPDPLCPRRMANPNPENSTASPGNDVITVFPNPAGNTIQLNRQLDTEVRVEITDLTGRRVMEPKEMSGTTLEFDLSSLPAGIYIFNVISGTGVTPVRVIKKQVD